MSKNPFVKEIVALVQEGLPPSLWRVEGWDPSYVQLMAADTDPLEGSPTFRVSEHFSIRTSEMRVPLPLPKGFVRVPPVLYYSHKAQDFSWHNDWCADEPKVLAWIEAGCPAIEQPEP